MMASRIKLHATGSATCKCRLLLRIHHAHAQFMYRAVIKLVTMVIDTAHLGLPIGSIAGLEGCAWWVLLHATSLL